MSENGTGARERERENDATAVWKRKRDESAFREGEGGPERTDVQCIAVLPA